MISIQKLGYSTSCELRIMKEMRHRQLSFLPLNLALRGLCNLQNHEHDLLKLIHAVVVSINFK